MADELPQPTASQAAFDEEEQVTRATSGSVIKKFETNTYAEVLEWWFQNPRSATLWWVGFCVAYWGLLVLFPSIYENDLSNANFAFWVLGMIGVCGVYYCVKAGEPADSPAGKPMMAFTCILMSIDWIATAHRGLSDDFTYGTGYEFVTMFCHSIG